MGKHVDEGVYAEQRDFAADQIADAGLGDSK